MSKVLIGMSLKPRHEKKLSESGIDFDTVELLEYTYQYDRQRLIDKLRNARQDLVITSGRSVNVLEEISSQHRPFEHNTYVVGRRTSERLLKLGLNIRSTALNCEELIANEPWNSNTKLLYLCGNLRRDILPDYWKDNNIAFEEVEVYQTHLVDPEVDTNAYRIILVSSPSGVTSLFQKNNFREDQVFASIGPVTTSALKEQGVDSIIESEDISFDTLIDQIKDYLT